VRGAPSNGRPYRDRREFIALLGGATVAWPLPLSAQQGERVRRIAVLSGGASTDPQGQSGLAAFAKGLQELGWTPGRNIAIEHRFAAGETERMRTLAKELVEWKPDLIVGSTTQVVAALQ